MDEKELREKSIQITTVEDAKVFILKQILTNNEKFNKLKQLFCEQAEIEEKYENKLKTCKNSQYFRALQMELLNELEKFAKKCHYEFYKLNIPFFSSKNNFSAERRSVILFIQDEVQLTLS